MSLKSQSAVRQTLDLIGASFYKKSPKNKNQAMFSVVIHIYILCFSGIILCILWLQQEQRLNRESAYDALQNGHCQQESKNALKRTETKNIIHC